MTTLHFRKSGDRQPLGRGLLLIAVVLTSLGLLPAARAVSPAPDGGYANGNTAEGTNALFHLTTGSFKTATGDVALFSNTTGNFNTATGLEALDLNTTGSANTATGAGALFKNTTGNFNTATGFDALFSNTTGNDNTATGVNALYNNTTGTFNTATGVGTLKANTTGNYSTANGFRALFSNTTGIANMANGFQALLNNTTGGYNTAEGTNALLGNTTGSGNISLGFFAGFNLTTGSNNIDIGHAGSAGESNTIRIGTVGTQAVAFVAGIHGVAVTGSTVVVNSSGQLGVAPSSARFKEAIKPMDKASEAILALKPVIFRYEEEIDPQGIPQFGLVAEEVEKVNPDLVVRDGDGKVYTVRYDAVNAMLLNEFLKEHRTVQEVKSAVAKQEATIAQQQKDFQSTAAEQQKEIKALAATVKEQASQ